MTNLFDLSGKVAVVTGGAGLIGEALTSALAEHEATVIVVDTDEAEGKRVIDDTEGDVVLKSVDITDPSAVEELLPSVADEFGSLDVLVNAAYPRTEEYGKSYEDLNFEEWRTNIDLHLNSYFLTTHTASLIMKEQPDGGSIVNLGSIYGVQAPDFTVYEETGMASPVVYSAIKGGIINMTRYVASHLGKHGVRANVISPGGVFNEQDPVFVKQYEDRTPIGRMAHPDDLKSSVIFLAADSARYITGQNIVVDGGWTII